MGHIYSFEVIGVKIKWSRILFYGFILTLFAFLFFQTNTATEAIIRSLNLCGRTVIPALFPYLVLSNLLSAGQGLELQWLNRVFGIHGNGVPAMVMGTFGGYPTGAKTAANLYAANQISQNDAERLLFFSCNAGPAFVLGMVGGALYHSTAAGFALFGIQILSSILCGLILPKTQDAFKKPQRSAPNEVSFGASLTHSIADAGLTMLKICAFILFFSVLLAAEKYILGNGIAYLLFCCVTEITAGVYAIAASQLSWVLKFILTSACISFGGLCVLMQTTAVLEPAGLKTKPYILGKSLQAFLSAGLAWPLSYFLAPVVTVGAFTPTFVPISPRPWTLLSVLLVFLIFRKFTTGNSPQIGL